MKSVLLFMFLFLPFGWGAIEEEFEELVYFGELDS